jgi:hypothetical protein
MLEEKDGSGREAICDRYHDEGDLNLKQNMFRLIDQYSYFIRKAGALIGALCVLINEPVHSLIL